METLTKKELKPFADNFKGTSLKNNLIRFGSFYIKAEKIIQQDFVNFSGKDLFDFDQQYAVTINQTKIKFYIQLYENVTSSGNKQFRLASYSQTGKKHGMIFTINMT